MDASPNAAPRGLPALELVSVPESALLKLEVLSLKCLTLSPPFSAATVSALEREAPTVPVRVGVSECGRVRECVRGLVRVRGQRDRHAHICMHTRTCSASGYHREATEGR